MFINYYFIDFFLYFVYNSLRIKGVLFFLLNKNLKVRLSYLIYFLIFSSFFNLILCKFSESFNNNKFNIFVILFIYILRLLKRLLFYDKKPITLT